MSEESGDAMFVCNRVENKCSGKPQGATRSTVRKREKGSQSEEPDEGIERHKTHTHTHTHTTYSPETTARQQTKDSAIPG